MNERILIENYTEEMLHNLSRLVKHNSVLSEAGPGMPFGQGPAACLKEMLDICQEMGFETKNLDNYCGYVEIGQGEEIIGIAGHLDIVPAGDGWTYDPFALTREGDLVYGRGTTDDKGPVLSALYAMRILKESGMDLHKRVRLIFGCNEETGSLCMEHYNKVAEPLTMGFTPDASYPLIFGEKGMMGMMAHSKKTRIKEIQGGFVSNAVCNECRVVIPGDGLDMDALKEALAKTKLVSSEVSKEGEDIVIRAQGIAAHASTPELGVNAAGCTMEALALAGFEDDFVSFYNSHIGNTADGAGLGLKLSDAYGSLTLNNGIIKMEEGEITCTIDIRFPVTMSGEAMRAACKPYLENDQGYIEILNTVEPLFFPKESPMVNALYKAYVDVTGDHDNQPMVIGGGTYAKSLPGIVAFGPEMPDKDYRIHNADEFASVTEMQQTVEIYLQAIRNMLEI